MAPGKHHRSPFRWLSDHLHPNTKGHDIAEKVQEIEEPPHRPDLANQPQPLSDGNEDEGKRIREPVKLQSDEPINVQDSDSLAMTIQNPEEAVDEPAIAFWDRAAAALAEESADLHATLIEYREGSDALEKSLTRPDGDGWKEDEDGDGEGPSSNRSIADVISGVAQRQMEDMEHRQWALPAKVRGKETRVRPLLRNILTYTSAVKEKADNLIDLDPTGYAKLAWLPFSLILDLATIDMDQYYAAMDAFSDLCLLIHRYTSVEEFYLYHDKDEVFERELIKLYTMVLKCQVALIDHFRRNGLLVFLRAAAGVDDWESTKQDIDLQDGRCRNLLEKYKDKGLISMLEGVKELVDTASRREISRVLNWIGSDPSGERRRGLEDAKLDSEFENAGRWLIDGDMFRTWYSAGPQRSEVFQAFWIHGPVGCGKTSLTTRVIEFFLEQAFRSDSGDAYVAYFYCSKRTGPGSSVVEIFRSLLRQLAYSPKTTQVDDDVVNAYKSRASPETDPLTLKECRQILSRLLYRSKSTALIIDALDECARPQELLSELKELSAAIKKLGATSPVKLFMSSRDDVNVTRILTDCESISITPKAVAGDFKYFVTRYVALQCERGHELGDENNAALRERLVHSVLTQGQGGFRWAHLQLQYLLDQDVFNPRDLGQRLDRLESGQGKPVLDDAYDQLYTRKTGEDMGEITHVGYDLQRILKWVLASAVPPRLRLIVEALRNANDPLNSGESAKDIDEPYILRTASNFLVLEQEQGGGGVLRFAHLSVKEYLLGARGAEYSDLESNLTLSVSCLVYIQSLSNNYRHILPSIDSAVMAISEYALRYWALHCARIGASGRQRGEVHGLLSELLRVAPVGAGLLTLMRCWSTWLENAFYDREIDDSVGTTPSPFWLACVWGFPEIIDVAVKQTPEIVHGQARNGRSGLHIAAYYGHHQIVRRLLEAGADVNCVEPSSHQTPLFVAADQGQVSTIQELLTREDIDINATNRSLQTPVFQAVSRGHAQAVRTLLQYGGTDINLDQEDLRGWTAVTRAAYFGYMDVMSELIASGRKIDWNAETNKQSALHWAVSRGHSDMAYLLINETSIDVNARDSEGWTLLAKAARDNDCGMIRALLQSRREVRLDVNAEIDRRTALLWAWKESHLDAVRLLLGDPRVDVNSYNTSPILNGAIENEVLEIAWLILETRAEKDIDINLRDAADETPLQKAVVGGHTELARRILSFQAVDVNVLNGNNESALSQALAYSPEIAELILQTRKDVDVSNKHAIIFVEGDNEGSGDENDYDDEAPCRSVNGFTVLHTAAMNRHGAVVKLLLRDFRDRLQVDAQNDDGNTALHLAAQWGSADILEMLLEDGGIEVNMFNGEGLTALHLAADKGHLDAARVLLRHGADIHARMGGDQAVTAEQCAVMNGHSQVAQLFRDWNASSNAEEA